VSLSRKTLQSDDPVHERRCTIPLAWLPIKNKWKRKRWLAPSLLAGLIGQDVLHKWYYVPLVYAVYCLAAMLALVFIPETRDVSLDQLDQPEAHAMPGMKAGRAS
jgi:hypothetical protein